MPWRHLTPTEIRKSIPVFIANLFFSIHYAALLYVNSSLLEEHFSLDMVSILFVCGAIGNSILFIFAPYLLKKLGNRALFFIFVLLDAIATAGLAVSSHPYWIAGSFLLFEAVSIMIYFNLDIFLEDASLEENTGEMRGIDLTIANTAIAVGPLLVAFFVIRSDFSHLYGIATLLLIPLLYQAFFSFKEFNDGEAKPHEHRFWDAFLMWWNDGDVKRITIARFVLEFFYAFMVIYVPIYIHDYVGFDWLEIGTMFTIMLIPFIILQLPAGEAADRWWGEKEMLIFGFFCCGASVLFMPWLGHDFGLWTLLLFISRIGAALVEVLTDTYFFKKVDKRDTGLISIFRLSRPAGIIAGAAWGIAVIAYTTYTGIFFTLAVISLWGIYICLRIRDTL